MDGSVVSQYDNVSCENFISLHCLQSLCVCVSEHVLLIAVPWLQDTPGGGSRGPGGPDIGCYRPLWWQGEVE